MKVSRFIAPLAALGTLSAGMAVTVSTAPVAHAVTSYSDVDCSAPSRMFQLRNDGRELWTGTVANASSTTPTVYQWTRVYEFSADRPALAVAAHNANSQRILLLVTDAGGGLRSYSYDLASKSVTSVNNLRAPGTAADPGPYAFNRLSSDGAMLYGVKGGKLYVMSGVSGSEAPQAYAEVGNFTGYPLAFFNLNATAGRSVTWTDTSGALRHTTLRAGANGWSASTSTLRNTGWGYSSITSPGAGLLLNDRDDNLLWRQLVDDPSKGTDTVITTHQTIDTATGVPDERIVTAPVCAVAATTPGALPSAPADNPNGPSTSGPGTLTPRAVFVRDQIEPRFPRIDCFSYASTDPNSDHHSGNALDCAAGVINEKPSDTEREQMNLLARWAATYAAKLDVKYVIWEQRIWSIGDANPGTPSAWRLMEDRGSIRTNHFDHVHISVQ